MEDEKELKMMLVLDGRVRAAGGPNPSAHPTTLDMGEVAREIQIISDPTNPAATAVAQTLRALSDAMFARLSGQYAKGDDHFSRASYLITENGL